jgi:vitamin K-dependent gamma-carboxylase
MRDALSRPVSIAWLVAFRILFGAAMFVSMLRFIGYRWIDEFFIDPPLHFKYWGFAWVPVLPRAEMHVLFWILAALALAVTVGFRHRAAAALFALGFTYLQLVDVATYLNHYYLASLLALLLAVAPAHRAFSIDALWDRSRRGGAVPAFWLYLFRFQVGVVYTFAGFAKAHGDWLVHAQPLRIWLGSHTDLPLLGPLFTLPGAPLVMSWAGFCFDTSVTWLLLFRPTRRFAYPVLLVFHTLTGILFPIGMFPVIMTIAALVFFPPEWPLGLAARLGRRFPIARLSNLGGKPADPMPDEQRPPGAPHDDARLVLRKSVLALAAAYCVVQIVVPLRFALYGGNVLWHEQGMRFSWRVMVREKNASVTYIVREVRTGRVRHVNPRSYVTRVQEREIAAQPDLVLQLAHHIRDDFERRGLGPVEIRADVFASLNGRRLQRLIDPEVDLATVQDGLGKAKWILPSPTKPPPHTQPI